MYFFIKNRLLFYKIVSCFFIKLIIWLFFILIKSKHYQNLILQIAKVLDIILGRWLIKAIPIWRK